MQQKQSVQKQSAFFFLEQCNLDADSAITPEPYKKKKKCKPVLHNEKEFKKIHPYSMQNLLRNNPFMDQLAVVPFSY